jgi:hypothetical protein
MSNFQSPTSHFLLSFPFVLYDFPIPISKSRRPTSQLPHSSQIFRFPLLPESIPITMSGPKSPNFPKSPSSSFPLLSQDGPISSSNCSTFSIPLSFQESSPPPVLISTSSTTPSLLHTCLSANQLLPTSTMSTNSGQDQAALRDRCHASRHPSTRR